MQWKTWELLRSISEKVHKARMKKNKIYGFSDNLGTSNFKNQEEEDSHKEKRKEEERHPKIKSPN